MENLRRWDIRAPFGTVGDLFRQCGGGIVLGPLADRVAGYSEVGDDLVHTRRAPERAKARITGQAEALGLAVTFSPIELTGSHLTIPHTAASGARGPPAMFARFSSRQRYLRSQQDSQVPSLQVWRISSCFEHRSDSPSHESPGVGKGETSSCAGGGAELK